MADQNLPAIQAGMKRCTKCAAVKPVDQFNLSRGRPRPACKPCHVASVVEWQRQNKHLTRATWDRFATRHGLPRRQPKLPADESTARRRLARTKWAAANPDADTASKRKWAVGNPHVVAERCRRYQAAKRQAVPAWADTIATAEFYAEAIRLTKVTGIPHEVDHIVPLVSPVVCGLHWEGNLQVLPKRLNRSKGNRLIEDAA